MEKKAKITIHPDYKIGAVDKRLYGAFLEPIHHWVYGGIWNPKHPGADDMGFRKDVLELIKSFGLPAVRFPGGNWTSGWEWENSIGPREQRKTQLDLAWRQYESNVIGHDEYIEWARRANVEPIYTLNLGSADLKSAFHCVDYSIHPGGTYWSDLRKEHGHPEPYNIKTWCLGNEMDGPWQIGSWEKDPKGYGVRAHETAKIMKNPGASSWVSSLDRKFIILADYIPRSKNCCTTFRCVVNFPEQAPGYVPRLPIKWINPRCETVVCGSCSPHTATYPAWDIEVLEQCYESVDYVSIHHYYNAPKGNVNVLLNASASFEDFIKTTIAACDYMKTKRRSRKTMMISFDEYGASFVEPSEPIYWYDGRRENIMEFSKEAAARPFTRYDSCEYENRIPHPRASQMLDALALNSIALSLIRHADRVKIGCMTGFIQHALGIDKDHAWKTAIYYAYEQLNTYGQGISLMPVIDGPVHPVEQIKTDSWHEHPAYDQVQDIEGAAVFNEEKNELSVFFINKNQSADLPVELDLRAFEGYKLLGHTEMYTADLAAANTWESQEIIKPVPVASTKLEGGRVSAAAQALSWNCIRIGL
jgi:alpha-N-arabinofuranosidase